MKNCMLKPLNKHILINENMISKWPTHTRREWSRAYSKTETSKHHSGAETVTMDLIILSDEEGPSTPFLLRPKKRWTELDPNPNRTVFVIDDDPTPHKSTTPSIVPETPMSALFDSEISIVQCTMLSDPAVRVSPKKLSGISKIWHLQ